MLNEERQTDKEMPGQTNGEMEGGWGILKISLGDGGGEEGGETLMDPKSKGDTAKNGEVDGRGR